jgi:hypothetical protein
MPLVWVSRCFFALVGAVAIAVVLSGTACTRWGQPGPLVPTIAPLSALYVNPATGSDITGNGSSAKPYKTFTKAVYVLATAKSLATSGVTIYLSGGDYTAANGEKFPIVIPTSVTIMGSSFGGGPRSGTFIDGFGEDTLLESLLHARAHTEYATMDVVPNADVSMSDVYVGSAKITLPANAAYASLDDFGTVSAATSMLGAGIVSSLPTISGAVMPGGTLSCSSCLIHGNAYGLAAFSIAIPTTSPSPSPSSSPFSALPSITLTHTTTDSTISSKLAGIITDGSVDVTVSGEHFERSKYAFADTLPAVILTSLRGFIDFGGGAGGSPGGNTFLGAATSEILIGRRSESVVALDDTWNPHQQQANGAGLYPKRTTFGPGTVGKNVTVRKFAGGSTVIVGPAVQPTPTPSSSPSPSPTPT